MHPQGSAHSFLILVDLGSERALLTPPPLGQLCRLNQRSARKSRDLGATSLSIPKQDGKGEGRRGGPAPAGLRPGCRRSAPRVGFHVLMTEVQGKTGPLAAALELATLPCSKCVWQCFRERGKRLRPGDTDSSSRTGSQGRLSHRRARRRTRCCWLPDQRAACTCTLPFSPGVGIKQSAPCATAANPLSSGASGGGSCLPSLWPTCLPATLLSETGWGWGCQPFPQPQHALRPSACFV